MPSIGPRLARLSLINIYLSYLKIFFKQHHIINCLFLRQIMNFCVRKKPNINTLEKWRNLEISIVIMNYVLSDPAAIMESIVQPA